MPKSKSKKRKLAHTHPYNQPKQHNTGYDGNLSYEEIWDDSALVRSWNDAVAEYQFYHSIHARGEDVEEVLRRYHAENGDGGEGEGEGEEGEVLDAELGDGDEEGEILEDGEVDADDKGVERANALPQPYGPESLISNDAKLQANNPVAQSSSTTQTAIPKPSHSITNGITSVHNATTTQPDSGTQPQAQTQPTPESNQILENIKMAYYWAGYYSGLYDAQRQTEPEPQ